MQHIAILVNPHDDFAGNGYLLRGIADLWRDAGHQVTVLRDPYKHVDADVGILHVDLTVVPDEYLNAMRRYPLNINATTADISKRKISSNIVRDGDGYKGPVIVKTNRNCGGTSEGLHAVQDSWLTKNIRAVRRRCHWSWRAEVGVWGYKVFESPAKVPLPVWFNPDLIIERFLPERHDGYYCMRTWCFLGEAEDCKIYYANQPVVKSPVAVRIEKSTVPDDMREIRRKLGFDYGKFDFGVVDGRAILYDANRTPVGRPTGGNAPMFRALANGIDSIFKPRYRAAG
jgi:hypothetical protein